MKNFTKEVFLMFFGLLLVERSSGEEEIYYVPFVLGMIMVLVSIVLFIKTTKRLKENNNEGNDSKNN